MSSQLATDEHVRLPWRRDSAPPPPDALHLVVVWFLGEPARTGHIASLQSPTWLGRGVPEPGEPPPIFFSQVRPAEALRGAPIDSTAVSRRQLVFEPAENHSVHVRSPGRRQLFHNGVPAVECIARAGDTLMLENTAVFLLEERPLLLPRLRHYPVPGFPFGAADPDGMVGESAAAWRLRDQLAAIATTDQHVLLLGESGSGKELAAGILHRLSAAASGPFVPRNAATFPPGLVDAELFGTARNYPNPGTPERDGLIAAADGGTLFLDEIGELSQECQAHLLRVLDQGGQYQRLGETQLRQSRFRLVAATNRDPASLKHDFFARFAARVDMPGFDERRSDIPYIATELVRRAATAAPWMAEQFLEGGAPRIDPVLMDALLRHPYTLHGRELNRLLALAATTSPDSYLTATPEVLRELRGRIDPEQKSQLQPARGSDLSDDQVSVALRETGGNVSRAAELLGVHRDVLRRLLKKREQGGS